MIKTVYAGRTGNILFQNIATSIISKKFDLKVESYNLSEDFRKIGMCLYLGGKRVFTQMEKIGDDGLMDLLDRPSVNCGIEYEGFFQVRKFVIDYKDEILSHFDLSYEDTYENMAFVHVRLGDVIHRNPGIDYYRKALDMIGARSGYISSDTFSHEIVSTLINEYNLIPYVSDSIRTIDFAKNFKNIILSQGTFSWWIGFLSRADKIIYPSGGQEWHGDIFVYDNWQPIKF